jgi:hypothetical protein
MIDRRGKLEEEPFAYNQTKDGKVHISWHGKIVMILKEKRADDILKKLRHASEKDTQLILAKVTGNFKRGNE